VLPHCLSLTRQTPPPLIGFCRLLTLLSIGAWLGWNGCEAEQAREMGKIGDLRAELDALKGQGERQK
jgi:hypothetical protein